MLYLTAFSVGASVALVAVFFVLFKAQPEDARAYFIPAVIVPAVVAPMVIHILLSLALALDAAHAHAAKQQEQLQQVRQLDLIGRLASGLAHDFNNLLTIVRANVDALGGTAVNTALAAIDDAALRGARLTRRLLFISRHEQVVLVPQPLAPLLRETEAMLRRVLPASVPLELPTHIPATVLHLDRDAVQQALLNLVLNARDAMDDHGRLAIAVQERSLADGPWIVIEVRDNGPGMSPEVLGHATEPFYTTKAAHQGTGLGLAIVQRTIEDHGGRLVIESA
ncbi:ATP-binding protein [Gemmatimonas sp.]|uniref:sensor histidine kinase n=1 Tax=Gemmatimonas sp. TaxID=1962908 RepID=UPI003341F424